MGNPNWKPGTSGNPKGRPPVSMSLAVAVRQKLPPEQIVDIMIRLLASEDLKIVLGTVTLAAAYGYGRPLSTTEITVRDETSDAPARLALDGISPERRAAMLGAIEDAERLAAEAEPDADGATEH